MPTRRQTRETYTLILTPSELHALWHLFRNHEEAVHRYDVTSVKERVDEMKIDRDEAEYRALYGHPRPYPWGRGK